MTPDISAESVDAEALPFAPTVIPLLEHNLRGWLEELAECAAMQLSIAHHGSLVYSAWAGRDGFSGRPIGRTTLFPLLSATKGIAAIVLLYLHEQGYFAWSDSVSDHWPQYARNGKRGTTIEHVLSHRAGLPGVTTSWRFWPDRDRMVSLIENASPEWPPGTRFGYHGGSWGVIVDELVRRWTQCETGEILKQLLLDADAGEDCFLGLPRARYSDVARLLYVEHEQRAGCSRFAPIGPNADYNSWHVLRSCQSSGGGVASADSLSRLYGLIANSGQKCDRIFWSADEQRDAGRPRNDPHFERPAARTTLNFAWGLGFMVSPSEDVYGTGPACAPIMGHPGASGAIAYANPDSGVSVAFTVNGVGGSYMYRRFRELGDILRRADEEKDPFMRSSLYPAGP